MCAAFSHTFVGSPSVFAATDGWLKLREAREVLLEDPA